MKYLNKIIFVLAIFLFASCNKEFLETSPTSFLNGEDFSVTAEKNPDILESTLNGLYSSMINTGTGGTTAHYDFGQKGVDIFTDMMSGDMALSVNTYNWFYAFTDLRATVDPSRRENYIPWRYYYRIIRSANLIIDGLGGNDVVPENQEVKYTLGQAKAIRAYAYFYLSQLFITEYTPDSKVLPIYTDPTQPNQAQSTTKEVYDLMISDLTSSISLLDGFARPAKNYIDQTVAKGLLAYVYASMATPDANQKALALSNEIVNSSYTIIPGASLNNGFNDVSNPSWIWGVDLTTDMEIGLVSFWGQVDIFTYSYAWAGDVKAIDSGLFDSISSDDVRKGQFYNNPASGYHLAPINKFYHPGRKIGGQRVVTTDYIFMRVEEFYLLSAELAAKTGDVDQAKTMLKTVLSQRVTDIDYIDDLSADELKSEIHKQTRVELWGEGKSYLALKRNKASVTRGANHLARSGDTFQYNDERLTWEIPQQEIRDNPLIN